MKIYLYQKDLSVFMSISISHRGEYLEVLRTVKRVDGMKGGGGIAVRLHQADFHWGEILNHGVSKPQGLRLLH